MSWETWIGWLVVLRAADAGATAVVLRRGWQEINPLWRRLAWWQVPVVAVPLAALQIGVILAMPVPYRSWLAILAVGMAAVPVMLNTIQVVRFRLAA